MTDQRGPVNIETFVEAMFGENSFLIYVNDGGSCWIVDPSFPPQVEEVLSAVRQHNLTPSAVVLTHGHADHIGGVEHVIRAYPDCPIWIGTEDDVMLTDADANLSAPFGIRLIAPKSADRKLEHGEQLELDGTTWTVLDTSGHSPGGRSFYCAEAGVVIVGDALFAGSMGRVDFPGSNGQQLIDNIRTHLYALPDETIVYAGHMQTTTIGQEKQTNPFVRP